MIIIMFIIAQEDQHLYHRMKITFHFTIQSHHTINFFSFHAFYSLLVNR